jgi:hypothetical protein
LSDQDTGVEQEKTCQQLQEEQIGLQENDEHPETFLHKAWVQSMRPARKPDDKLVTYIHF